MVADGDAFWSTPRSSATATARRAPGRGRPGAAGRDVLFDIDWQGTQQLAERARQDLVSVFILPPSTEELERRLRARAQDSDVVDAGRMAKAADEMSHWAEYDYVIVNTDLDASVAEVQLDPEAERLKRERQVGLFDFVEQVRRGL